MKNLGHCPRCQSQIEKKRLQAGIEICQACGWSSSEGDHRVQKGLEKRFIVFALLLSALVVAAFVQSVTWDQFAVKIIPLKAKQYSGQASSEELREIIRICKIRQHQGCVEQAHKQWAQLEPANLEALAALGNTYRRNKKNEKAVQAFVKYFAQGGTDIQVAYEFAQVLGATGRVEDAKKYYFFVLNSKPDSIQITVLQKFVDLLVEQNSYAEAKALIEQFREKGSGFYLDPRYQQIVGHLASLKEK